MNTLKNKLCTAFYSAMQVQFFISLISLPILVAWGLPFSVMTVLGNMLFTPILMLFLLISSLIFFSELLHIPNGLCVLALEKLFALWMYLLQFGSTKWLYGIDHAGLVLCAIVACATAIILQHRQWGRQKKSVPLFALLLITPFAYQTVRSWWPKKGSITCIRRTVDLQKKSGKINIYDRGALGEKKSSGGWVQYTLLPEALKQCGSIRFGTIECPYCSENTLKALSTLCKHAPLDRVVITHPARQSKEYKSELKKLIKELAERNITLEVR